jgi:uncharacterized protein with ParB-like and HNH nuclease domain
MVANEKSFKQFLETRDIHFTIPVYQRPYSWQEDQCQQLLDDLQRIASEDIVQKHFIGSVVYVNQGLSIGSRNNHYVVVDGQQRITTLSLLLLALAHQYATYGMPGERERILRYFIINEYAAPDAEDLVKLKPLNMDKAAYRAIVAYVKDGEAIGPDIEAHLMVKNFRYFVKQCSHEQIPALYQGFETLEFVSIQLEPGKDDPQKIFESLNSTGLGLSQSDLIRNYLLMNLEVEKQTEYYKRYWEPIENMLSVEHIPSFFRDYIRMRYEEMLKINSVYREYKLRSNLKGLNKQLDHPKLIEEFNRLKGYASAYQWITQAGKMPDEKIRQQLKHFEKLSIEPLKPFFLELLYDWAQKIVSSIDVTETLEAILSYVVRRFVVELPSSYYTMTFIGLYKRLDKSNLSQDLKLVLLSKKGADRFPTDEELKSHLLTKNIYEGRREFKRLIFEQMENVDTKAKVDIMHLSIEHVMPKKLTKDWESALGPDFNRIHNTYLHTLSNLTLTEYNSVMSNKEYSAKMDTLHKQSRLWFNQYFKSQLIWNEAALLERHELLFQRFIQVWPYPHELNRTLKSYDTSRYYLINEVGNPTGIKLHSYVINQEEHSIKRWNQLMLQLIKKGFEYDEKHAKTILERTAVKFFAFKLDSLPDNESRSRYQQVVSGVWINTNQSAKAILQFLRYWTKSFGWEETLLLRFEEQ